MYRRKEVIDMIGYYLCGMAVGIALVITAEAIVSNVREGAGA